MTLMKQTDFADRHGVSRKTVTKWKQDGRLVLQGDLVDVEASDARLRSHRRGRFADGKAVTLPVTQTRRGNSEGGYQGNSTTAPLTWPTAGFTPQAGALLAVLHLEGGVLLDHFLTAYGVPVTDRLKACEAFAMTIGYVGQGLYVGADADLQAWNFDVRHPDIPEAIEAVDAEMEPITAELHDRADDPTSPVYAAIQAGLRARVGAQGDGGAE